MAGPPDSLVYVCKHWLLPSPSKFHVPLFQCHVLHFWCWPVKESGCSVAILVMLCQVGKKVIRGREAPEIK